MENIVNIENLISLESNTEKYAKFLALYEISSGKDNHFNNTIKTHIVYDVLIATIMDNDKLLSYLVFFIAKGPRDLEITIGRNEIKTKIGYPAGVLDCIGVVRHSDRKNMANDLVLAAENYFIENNINSSITPSLEYNGIVPAKILLKKTGYKILERLITPWKNECYVTCGCPHRDHKNHKCICNAVVYYKTDLLSKKQIMVA
jgi:hypothetical protein